MLGAAHAEIAAAIRIVFEQKTRLRRQFAAELVVIRGANAPDAVPRHERRLDAEIAERYGAGRTVAQVSDAWRPYRTWAAVHLRVLREDRAGEIAGR